MYFVMITSDTLLSTVMNPKFRQVYITAEQAEKITVAVVPLMPKVNRLTQPTIHSATRALVDYALAQLEKAKANDNSD